MSEDSTAEIQHEDEYVVERSGENVHIYHRDADGQMGPVANLSRDEAEGLRDDLAGVLKD